MSDENKPAIIGAAPEGTRDPQSAARAMREMFASIAPRYDLLNHMLSFSVDRLWWWRAARTFDGILERPETRVLDVCCGTGDMTFALRQRAGGGSAQILGTDFSHAMLQRASSKSVARTGLSWIEVDALRMTLHDALLCLVTAAIRFWNIVFFVC